MTPLSPVITGMARLCCNLSLFGLKHNYNLSCLFFFICILGLSTKSSAQEGKSDTIRTDSSIIKLIDHVDAGKTKVDKLSATKIEAERKVNAEQKKIDSLKTIATRNRNANLELVRAQKNIKMQIQNLQAIKQSLSNEKLNYDTLLTKLKTDVARLAQKTATLKTDSSMLKKNIDSLKKVAKTESDRIRIQQATIAAQMDSMEVIAQFKMYDTLNVFVKVRIDPDLKDSLKEKGQLISYYKKKHYRYDKFDNPLKIIKTPIQKVHILAREGIMREIVVTTGEGIFRNKSAVIDLAHMDSRNGDTLRYEKQKYHSDGDYRYIFLDDAVSYTPMRSYTDLPYADFDITLTPDSIHRLFLLRESTSINSYVNVSAFTDIKGISGEPNGIAQFQAEAKFITNTKNIKNGATVYLNYLSFEGGLSKYDSKFKGTMLINKDSINRGDLFQRSNYSVGVKLNLLHGLPSPFPKHLLNDWQINVGYNFVGSRVSDTTFKDKARTIIDTSFRTVTLNEWYIEPQITVARHNNFALTLSLPFHAVNIKESAKIKNSYTEYWASPSIDLMYYGKRDTGNKLFFRYHHYINLSNNTQSYSQLQLGYSLSLTSVWGNK